MRLDSYDELFLKLSFQESLRTYYCIVYNSHVDAMFSHIYNVPMFSTESWSISETVVYVCMYNTLPIDVLIIL